ncbi:hypothetical protein WCP94_001426 [Bilophila wadsworthia]
MRGLFSFLGKMLILSGMASSPPRPKRRKSWEGERWGRGGGKPFFRKVPFPLPHIPKYLQLYKELA